MTCPLARNFAAWVEYAVRPAARIYFHTEVVKVETYGTYSCRNIYGGRSGRLSQHATSNAVDVAGFVLADGRRIMLDGGWHGRSEEHTSELQSLMRISYAVFCLKKKNKKNRTRRQRSDRASKDHIRHHMYCNILS